MNKKLFIEAMTDIAEWQYPGVSENGRGRESVKPRARTANSWIAQPELGPRIVKYNRVKSCEYCRKPVRNQTIEFRKYLPIATSTNKTPRKEGWWGRCKPCNRWIDRRGQLENEPKPK